MFPSFVGQRRVGAGEDVPIDSHCEEDERKNLGANNEFLTKESAEEHNGDDEMVLETRKSRARSTVPICRGSRERWECLQRKRLLQWRRRDQRKKGETR